MGQNHLQQRMVEGWQTRMFKSDFQVEQDQPPAAADGSDLSPQSNNLKS